MVSQLWQKTNYTNRDIDYLKNVTITEYDISSAGMNILYDLGAISADKYLALSTMPKRERVVAIGMLLKDKEMNEIITYGFEQARKVFIEKNKLEDGSILSIKRDAFYLINKDSGIDGRVSPHIEFRKGTTYNSFMQINKREHYLEFSRISSNLEVKGYRDAVKIHQKDYLFKFLKDIMIMDLLGSSKKDLYIELLKFKDAFITQSLDVQYYREIDEGVFPVLATDGVYGIPELDTSVIPLDEIDKRVNMDFILSVINLILGT